MAANAFFSSTIILMALGLYALGELRFLIPYKQVLLHECATPVAAFLAALYINLFYAIYTLGSGLFLKDTGRKLAHLEKQLRSGTSISEELSERLKE